MSSVQVPQSHRSSVKVLAFTRNGRAKQLQQVVNEERLPVASVVDGPVWTGGLNYGLMDMVMGVFSIVCYVLDIVLEARLAAFFYAAAVSGPPEHKQHFNNKTSCQQSEMPDQSVYMVWFYVTVAFIVIPGFICGLCSLSWHITDFRMRRKEDRDSTSLLRDLLRVVLPLLLLGPVLHNVEAILFALAARGSQRHRRIHLHEQALFEDADAALLRIIECFLESLPQLVLQLHIVMASANFAAPLLSVSDGPGDTQALPLCTSLPPSVKAASLENHDPICSVLLGHFAEWFPSLPLQIDCQLALQFVSMVATLLGAAWALVSYQRVLRRFLFSSHRQLPLFPCSFVLFLAHLVLLSGRVLAIVLFVQALGWGALVGLLFCHTLAMFVWLQCGCTTSSKKRSQLPAGFCCANSGVIRGFFNFVLSLMYTSAYINVFDTPSCARYTFFFSVTLVENTAFILSWFFLSTASASATAFSTLVYLLITSLSLVFGGVLLLLIYYKFFHPNVFLNSKISRRSSSCCNVKKKQNTAANSTTISLTQVNDNPK